ncbi:MAG TPA: hypothetical protein DCS97_03005, partial [Planctomycetes bacterium]|nr:hypothetical protein [Planctomycetota bacterium]
MPDDAAQIASELSGLLKAGAADPLSLLAGEWRFHACFLAPFSPAFAESRRQFLIDGGGPLSATVEQLRHQGLSASEATETARKLIESATGLCVAVVAGDHGVASIPQPFFGHISPEWRQGAAQVLAEPYRTPFAGALAALEAQSDRNWPRLVAGPAVKDGDLVNFWLELAHGVAEASELAGLREDARQADLGHWTAEAVAILAGADELDAEDHAALCRCRLVAGDFAAATSELAACAAAGGEAEAVELLDHLASTVCRAGGPPEVAAWLAEPPAALAGSAYDVAFARVRILAALGGGPADLRP